MLKTFFVLLMMFSSSTFAKVFHLVEIYNQEDHEVSVMYLNLDDDNNILSLGKKILLNGEVIEDRNFGNQITDEGIVLKERRNKDIIILRGYNLDHTYGGTLELDYLFNGITGSRSQFMMDINRTSDGWQLTQNGKIISRMLLESHRKPFIGLVGIRKVVILK